MPWTILVMSLRQRELIWTAAVLFSAADTDHAGGAGVASGRYRTENFPKGGHSYLIPEIFSGALFIDGGKDLI